MEGKSLSKILIIGGTGYLGRYLIEASVRLRHPTFALVREKTIASDEEKASLVASFKNDLGVQLLYVDIYDHNSLVQIMKKVDIVFSIMGHDEEGKQLQDQAKIISAIKEAGNIMRFFPSEFGFDVEHVRLLEPAKSILAIKAELRKYIRMEGIPYTFVSSNFGATYFLSRLGQVDADGLPNDRVYIIGDGNPRVIYLCEEDIATYSILAADDPRAENKILYMRPPANIYSLNELVSLWEKKINKTLERIYIPEEEVIRRIHDSPPPLAFIYAVAHASFINGDQTNFSIDSSTGVEASELYPDVKYTTVEEYYEKYI